MSCCYQTLQKNVKRDGFVVFYNHKVQMSRFLKDIDGVSASLSQMGLSKGDVVTVYLPSCIQAIALFYACSKLGLVANFVHPQVPLNMLKQNLQQTQSKALFFYDWLVKDESTLLQLNQQLVRCSIADYVGVRKLPFGLYSALSVKRAKGVFKYAKLARNDNATPCVGGDDDVLCYMHSGGTSGEPKIVKLTNANFDAVARGLQHMHPFPNLNQQACLVSLPVFHAYGLAVSVHAPLIMRYNMIVMPAFEPKSVVRYMKKYNVAFWCVVPAMLQKLAKYKLLDNKYMGKIETMWCGGDSVDEKLVNKVDDILAKRGSNARLFRGYGLTEVCGVCTANTIAHYCKGSCGKAMLGCSVAIVDDDGNKVDANVRGEVVVCSPGLMSGYLQGEDSIFTLDGKKYIRTGDVGYLNEDGYLFLVDRKKRTLKISAVNVFPAEIEACVKTLPFVEDACAVGVVVDGKQYVKVYVCLSQSVDASKVEQQVKKVCQDNLIKYCVPQYVQILPAMPRTVVGKVDYKALQQQQR